MKLSGSIFNRALHCPASLKSEGQVNVKNDNADRGTAIHARIATDDALLETLTGFKRSELHVEEQIDFPFGHGTPDAWAFGHYKKDQKKTLYVFDWKTGGQFVSDMDVAQQLFYAYLIHKKHKIWFDRLIIKLYNPDQKTWSTRVFDFSAMKEIEKDIKFISKNPNLTVTGPHCVYCKRALYCADLTKRLRKLIGDAKV